MELNPAGGSWYIEIKRESDGKAIILCLIEWVLENQISEEGQTLPESLYQMLEKRFLPKINDALAKVWDSGEN